MIIISPGYIEGITLLELHEAQALPLWLRGLGAERWWWLKTQAYAGAFVFTVQGDGTIQTDDYFAGSYVCCPEGYVRPALVIRMLDKMRLRIGETMQVLGRLAYYIGDNKVLFCEAVEKRRFGDERCKGEYEGCELEAWLRNWLEREKVKAKNDEWVRKMKMLQERARWEDPETEGQELYP